MSLQRFGTRHINSTAFCGKEQQQSGRGAAVGKGARRFHAGSQGPPGGSLILGKDTGPCCPLQRREGLPVLSWGLLVIRAGAPGGSVGTRGEGAASPSFS